MKNTIEAVRYGIETLKVTPAELFSLIESSNGYSGEDYGRWLANEIIKIAEKDGVGFSQLLVKKFSIIQSLSEDSESVMKEEWVEYFSKMLDSKEMYSVNFEQLGTDIEDVDWFNGIDYDEENSFFVAEELPDELAEAIKNKEELSLVCKLSSKPSDKSSELFKSAKGFDITCKNEGSLMLYRMCSIVETFQSGKEFKFAFFTNTDFLTNPENASIFNYFLNYFNCKGVVVKSTNLYSDMFISTNYAFVVCTPRVIEKGVMPVSQDGLVFRTVVLGSDGEFKEGSKKRYTRSEIPMLTVLRKSKTKIEALEGKQVEIYGYLNLSSSQDMWLSYYEDESAHESIPITKSNLYSVIVYYSVTKSLKNFGFSAEITQIITGNGEYKKLLYNCLPLFLYDTSNQIKNSVSEDGTVVKSELSADSPLITKLLEAGEVYFSYEAKELLNVCRGLVTYLKENNIDTKGMSFEELRKEANNADLNEAYMVALVNIKDYIKTLYRGIE